MDDYITLKNVIDTRNGQSYSEAIVSEQNLKWFVPKEKNESLNNESIESAEE